VERERERQRERERPCCRHVVKVYPPNLLLSCPSARSSSCNPIPLFFSFCIRSYNGAGGGAGGNNLYPSGLSEDSRDSRRSDQGVEEALLRQAAGYYLPEYKH
jgi:hypothetical protein